MTSDQFIVVCREDERRARKGEPTGRYVLASRRIFVDLGKAQDYARGIAAMREPIIVSGQFDALRLDAAEVTP